MVLEEGVFFSLTATGDQALHACSCLCETAGWDCRALSPGKRCREGIK